ncbi:MAG: TolC family protein [Planctomyces sp.]|nr:TolC family protein [Planctomyces sp.]
MQWHRWKKSVALALTAVMLPGCTGTNRNVSYLGNAELNYYKNAALTTEYAAVDQATPLDIVNSDRPRTIKDRTQDEIWDLPLMDGIHMAIANNKMIRTRTQFLAQSQLLVNPAVSPSVYDPALRQTGFLFGTRGVEAALADFDTQFTSSMLWGRNESIANSSFGTSPLFGLSQETGNFNAALQKTMANGGTVTLSHSMNYLGTNQPFTTYPSSYTGAANINYSLPLWGGSGVEYTRIAGPSGGGLGAITGVSQGVVIARINEDIALADFENAVINMVKDVEDLYWDLYLAYRQYDADVANRDSSLRSWREVKARMEVGATGGNAAAEAQARENYFDTRSRVENSLANIYDLENQFRRLIGLGVNDGRIIRPADSPVEGEYMVNWETSLTEALVRRVELRRQKWQIKSLELQTIAAKSLTNPQLNFVSQYGLNAFGNQLISEQTANYNSAYGTLKDRDLENWSLGFQLSMPIGFRQAYAQLRNTELQLTKARAALAAQEQDISHELANAIQRIETAYVTARTNLDRRIASARRVEATQAEYEAGVRDATLDLVLRAQASQAQAEIALFTSLVNYNKAINDLNYRKGTVLDNSNISLGEGEWTYEAQQQALGKAWARSHAFNNPLLRTSPEEFSSPVPYQKTDLTWQGLNRDDGLIPQPAGTSGSIPPAPLSDPSVPPAVPPQDTTTYDTP